ncbi:MAG: hypothetical protein WCQ89_19925 [Verrucomicrobiota bacterium]
MPDAFDERLHAARPHAGQLTTAANLRNCARSPLRPTSRPMPLARCWSPSA